MVPPDSVTACAASVVTAGGGAMKRRRGMRSSLIHSRPVVLSNASPRGWVIAAAVGAPPSPQPPGAGQALPLPAIVVMIPVGEILRMRPESSVPRYRAPDASTAMPVVQLVGADVAAPPSPHGSAADAHDPPLPATVVTTPVSRSMRRITSVFSLTYRYRSVGSSARATGPTNAPPMMSAR